ncbi:MAG: hypothetical protein B7Y56_02010 [Gallionellales bacterium 35-53-114]|nr:MAG: hypothetical protein B7Y56_02010 [Gallionellales bacterium 35-53-114]OYZ64396.1 MAG: hypothetical protein B7Y04_05790 [Gallionellales bacterium 24-53-125]OZB10296.1 MAG: hypothetical protein B7X61_01915 [Gallionellales bacterium 39-52-133]HQS56894.1 hypothetical protein [Gallionellaceae bacterium]HQS75322.1 hypothetical protein [Gallionellaceae bacterium]
MFITEAILLRYILLYLLVVSVVGVLAGALLLWRPEWLGRINKFANRWVSTRQMARPLAQSFNLDHWFYRYGCLSGAVLMLGALYVIYIFTSYFGRAGLMASLMKMHLVPPGLVQSLVDGFVLVSIMGAILALLVSLFLIFRPSMLRDLEQSANRRISLRQSLKPLEMQHQHLEQLVFRHAQKTGLALMAGGLYILAILLYWMARQA